MGTPLRVLLVEDSENDALLLLRELRRGGYALICDRVETPEAMEAALAGEAWDAIISDYYLPRFSAPAALEVLREKGLDLPFIVVSGKVGEEAAVEMMQAGAHDYVTKENMARLCPAIERQLRQAEVHRERRRAEEDLKEGEQRYRAVVEQAAEGILVIDVGTKRILEANAAYQDLLGYAPEEILRLTLYDMVPYPRESMDCYVERVQGQRNYVSGERQHRRKDGSLVDVEVSANLISYGGKEAMCMVIRDITERKRTQWTLQEIREAERNRMARDLHDGVLQDLSYITLAMQVTRKKVEHTDLQGELQGEIDGIRRAVEGLREAVYDLRLGEENRPFLELVESLVEQNRRMAPDRDIWLDVEEGLPSASLGHVGTELLRIVQEALTNTRRHSGARHVRVALRAQSDDLVAEVSDDGRGFETETAPGIGLRSMRERAAALSGKLDVQSEPGGGTRVRLRAPMPGLLRKRLTSS